MIVETRTSSRSVDQIRSGSFTVKEVCRSPVFSVPFGSKKRTSTSSFAKGLCSTPFGTITNSPASIVRISVFSSMNNRPERTRNSSSSLSCLCQMKSPLKLGDLYLLLVELTQHFRTPVLLERIKFLTQGDLPYFHSSSSSFLSAASVLLFSDQYGLTRVLINVALLVIS